MTAEVDEGAATPRVDLTALWRPALLYAASRAFVLLAFVVAGATQQGVSMYESVRAWDGGFYLGIANHGYPNAVPAHGPSDLAFFPMFPLAIRFFRTTLGLSDVGGAMVAVTVFGLVAACCIWLLTRELATPEAADRATALFAFAPGSFVLSMIYSEALFVLCAVTACWALIRRRWILAGVIGAVGTAARPDGLAIVLAAACAAYVAIRQRNERRALVAIPIALSGFVLVQLYLWAHTGDVFAFFAAEKRGWRQGFSSVGTGRWHDVQSIWRTINHGGRPDWNHVVPLLGMAIFVWAFVLLVRWRPPLELIGLTVGLGYFAFTSANVGFRPRLVMAAFPLAMAVAVKLRRGPWFAIVLGSSACLLMLLAITTTATHYVTP